MGWETRNGRGRYYTVSRRRNGRVTREYVGCGELAVAVAGLDAMDRADRAAQRAALAEERESLQAADAALAAFDAAVTTALQAELTAAGYRQHHRGEWRLPRGNHETA